MHFRPEQIPGLFQLGDQSGQCKDHYHSQLIYDLQEDVKNSLPFMIEHRECGRNMHLEILQERSHLVIDLLADLLKY